MCDAAPTGRDTLNQKMSVDYRFSVRDLDLDSAKIVKFD
jgi:hypothetical protein